MPGNYPSSYTQRALAQALAALTAGLQGGEFARYVDVGVVESKTPSDVSTGSLFVVSGGRVQISHIEGRVTTQLQAASRTLKLQFSPDTAVGDTDLSGVSADVSGLAVGKKLVPTGTLATALSIANYELALKQATTWILEPGVLKLVSSSTAITGVIKWMANWKPLDSGASLSAA